MNKQPAEWCEDQTAHDYLFKLKDSVVTGTLLILLLCFAFATHRPQTKANKINLIFHTLHNMQDRHGDGQLLQTSVFEDMKGVIVNCLSALSTAPWCIIMVRASIISQTQQKGSVGFLENDVKLFCMLLFARCLLWCQGSGVIGGNLLSAWNLCLNVYAAAAQYHWAITDHASWEYAGGVTFISTVADEARSLVSCRQSLGW